MSNVDHRHLNVAAAAAAAPRRFSLSDALAGREYVPPPQPQSPTRAYRSFLTAASEQGGRGGTPPSPGGPPPWSGTAFSATSLMAGAATARSRLNAEADAVAARLAQLQSGAAYARG